MARVDNLNIDGTAYEIGKIASTTNLGVVQVGDGLSITQEGVLSATGGSPQQEATKLTMENLDTARWGVMGTDGAYQYANMDIPDEVINVSFQCNKTLLSDDIQFIDESDNIVTLQNLWTRIENGEKFNITIPFGDISAPATASQLEDLEMTTASDTILDSSNKGVFTIKESGVSHPTTAYFSDTIVLVSEYPGDEIGFRGTTAQKVPFGILNMDQGGTPVLFFLLTKKAYGEMPTPV